MKRTTIWTRHWHTGEAIIRSSSTSEKRVLRGPFRFHVIKDDTRWAQGKRWWAVIDLDLGDIVARSTSKIEAEEIADDLSREFPDVERVAR